MNSISNRITDNKKAIWGIKSIFCLIIIAWLFCNFFINGIDKYTSYKDYYLKNEFNESISGIGCSRIEQQFIAPGNILSNITLYFGELLDEEIKIEIVDKKQQVITQRSVNLKDYMADSWNQISIDCMNLKRGEQYSLIITGEDLSSLIFSTNNSYPKCFSICYLDDSETRYTLALGLQFTYKYMLLGYRLELFVRILYIFVIAASLCFTVINIEKILKTFRIVEKKRGILYALYFSVYTVLIFNPLDTIRSEVTAFSRIIGAGINAGVDVSKRISSFSQWFIYFAVLFILFYMLANYLKSVKLSSENKKVSEILDNIIIVANVILGLRCFSYFFNESQESTVFYYSDFFIMLLLIIAVAYILLDLEKNISADKLQALLVCGWMMMLPVSIVITHEWAFGRTLMGFQVLISILIVIIVKFIKLNWNNIQISSSINYCVVFLSLIPFCTSFYIEFVTILNQHKIFLVSLRRYYFYAVIIGVVLTAVLSFLFIKKNRNIKNWKSISYLAILFGFSCLWLQVPITSTYNADLFETANSSILISDFLNFGDIPIINHYGGHMMTGVWEGIIYALLNNDIMGANFSPYSEYIAAVIAIVFYSYVKNIWDEDSAILVVLFFPFYSFIGYWGLGILTVLAAIGYVRKNTYFRAVLFWAALIWCAIYRLDLGFAFVFASIVALLIYMVSEKNLKALKQLIVTLGVWAIIGGILWFGICIIKGINPFDRLLEFLMINFSNQNWAYSGIGDITLAKFAFTYLIVPFTSIIMLLFTIFDKRIKENMDCGCWVAILIIGLAYFFNFSRGLVRHSLAEDALSICLWSAPMFITLFIMSFKGNKKLFLPILAICILCYTLLQTDSNFTGTSVSDIAVGKIGTYTETWTLSKFSEEETPEGVVPLTYWEKLAQDGDVIERVKWDSDLVDTIQKYQIMIDALLDEGETFVDCINKTSIYPLLGRQNPVYVSQSPMQLSGQFTQEQFIEEMEGIPIVLMPFDANNERASESLDQVPNLYRYYKVFEYIYQNYVPLCTYEDCYAIWCLSERYNEMETKINKLMDSEIDIKDSLVFSENIVRSSVETLKNDDGSININYTGADPGLYELQSVMDLTSYLNKNIAIAVDYETDVLGEMQMFYTTEKDEYYTDEKICNVTLTDNCGTACFRIPITEYSRIRFDIPEGSHVKIIGFRIGVYNCKFASYGYDGPYPSQEIDDYLYLPSVHNYALDKLPLIWAENDKESSVNNAVVTSLNCVDGIYRYDLNTSNYGDEGNYLKLSLRYDGLDLSGKTDSNDETIGATLKIGKIVNGYFELKYYYTFTIKEGFHDYMFRISNDYYWYHNDTDSVMLECDGKLLNVNMDILEGD